MQFLFYGKPLLWRCENSARKNTYRRFSQQKAAIKNVVFAGDIHVMHIA